MALPHSHEVWYGHVTQFAQGASVIGREKLLRMNVGFFFFFPLSESPPAGHNDMSEK